MTHVITQISQAVKNSERVNIYLNGKFWLGLSKNNLVSLRLFKGQQLSELEKHEVEQTAYDGKLVSKALGFMRRRPRSCFEVKEYLVVRKKVSAEEADNVIVGLKEQDLLSDEKFAKWYVDYKSSTSVNGINKIKAELLQKKVDAQIVKEVLETTYADDEFAQGQQEKIAEFIDKVVRTIKGKNSYEIKAKITNRLLSRGFTYGEIKKALEKELRIC